VLLIELLLGQLCHGWYVHVLSGIKAECAVVKII
jgi:hypothetical protein